MIRGRGAYGAKPNKTVMRQLMKTGIVSTHHYDDTTGVTTIHQQQDVTQILKANVEDFNSGHDGYNSDRDMKHVARIPNIAVAHLYKLGINVMNENDWPKVAAMLDSNEFAKYRTSPGRISRRPIRNTPTRRLKR